MTADYEILNFGDPVILIGATPVKISPTLIEQIARETGLKLVGWPFSEALSERGGSATSYVVMFEYDLGAIMTALQASGS